jgi:hypothetical protein
MSIFLLKIVHLKKYLQKNIYTIKNPKSNKIFLMDMDKPNN